MVRINLNTVQFITIWTLISAPVAFAQRSTLSHSGGITHPSNTTATAPPVSNPNDISNGTSSSGGNVLCTATQGICEYTLSSSGGPYIQRTCCDSGSTCIPYGNNAGLCIPSAFTPSACPKARTCVPTSTLDGDTNALLLGPQCCSADEFCSDFGCVKEVGGCDASTVCIPNMVGGRGFPYPFAAQCCKQGGACTASGCQYPEGGAASNSTGTGSGSSTGTSGSGSCGGSFVCDATKICVPTQLADGTASSSVLPAQCCGSEQFCGATGCLSGAFDDRGNFRRVRRGRMRRA